MPDWYEEPYKGGPMVPVPGECIPGRSLQNKGYSRETVLGVRMLGHRIAWERGREIASATETIPSTENAS